MEDFIAGFSEVSDPRQENVRHNLHEVLIIALCTLLCGGEDCADMAVFGRTKRMTLNLARLEGSKRSIKGKRKRAGWNDEFLARLLGQFAKTHMR